jgi:hypothetical protein
MVSGSKDPDYVLRMNNEWKGLDSRLHGNDKERNGFKPFPTEPKLFSAAKATHYERKKIPPYGSKDPDYVLKQKKERFQTVPYMDIIRAT